jgi:hypothetical protein
MKSDTKTEIPEMPEMIPLKQYKFGEELLSSKEMAEILQYGIKKIDKKLKSTSDARKIKKLKDKKRLFLLYMLNEDIKQFLK